MNAQWLADFAFRDQTIKKDYLAMLRSVWKSNMRRGGASRERLMIGLIPAVEQAARLAHSRKLDLCHWRQVFPDPMRADSVVLLTDMCIAAWEKRS